MRLKKEVMAAVLCGWFAGISHAACFEPTLDFYTPMSQMVFPDRTYLLTSNAWAWLNMGSGTESYETLTFLKFSDLPAHEVKRAWLRLASGPVASMGAMTRDVLISVHPVDMDVNLLVNYTIMPKDFYVNENHILPSVDRIYVYKDGVCYWDITEMVNNWIRCSNTGGTEGAANLGLAVTGRDDAEALTGASNQHVGFYSSRADAMPHAARPILYTIESEADAFDMPWIPDWSGNSAYTHQFWTLSATSGRLQQPAIPDGYCDNTFGEPNVVWEKETSLNGVGVINPFLAWHPFADSSDPNGQPDWVDGVYGGVYRGGSYGTHTMTAVIPTGTDTGGLTVFVQYDWYSRGMVEVSVSSGCDKTPAIFNDHQIGRSGQQVWYRSTRVFEIQDNPVQIEVKFTVSGEEPYIDSFSVTTAINAIVPQEPLRHDMDENLDGIINFAEFLMVAGQWGRTSVSLYSDFDGDGDADGDDLSAFAAVWLKESPYRYLQSHGR